MSSLVILNLSYGSIRPMAISSCPIVYSVINNIIESSKNFDICFVINSEYRRDNPIFSKLPPMFLAGSQDCLPLEHFIKELRCRNKCVLKKNELSCLSSQHNLLLMKDTAMHFAGFSTSFDIVPSCIDAIKFGLQTSVLKNCVGNIFQETIENDLKYLNLLGIRSI